MLHRGGVAVAGYVDTDYGRRPARAVGADVARYRSWYPQVRAVFLDRVAATGDLVGHYAGVARNARTAGMETVVFHHGVHPDPAYAAHADLLGTFEGPWTSYRNLAVPWWARSGRSEQFLHLVHTVPGRAAPDRPTARGVPQRRRGVRDRPPGYRPRRAEPVAPAALPGAGGRGPGEDPPRRRRLDGGGHQRGRRVRGRTDRRRGRPGECSGQPARNDAVGAAAGHHLAVAAHGPGRHVRRRRSLRRRRVRQRRGRRRRLHGRGRRVVCYLSAGSLEGGRPDAGRLPRRRPRRPLDGWPGERWLDIRAARRAGADHGRPLRHVPAKGFDGVEADNVDGYAHHTGFPLTAADQLRYNRFLAAPRTRAGCRSGSRTTSTRSPSSAPSSTGRSTSSASSTTSATGCPVRRAPARRSSRPSTSSRPPPSAAARAAGSCRCASARSSTPGAGPADHAHTLDRYVRALPVRAAISAR